MQKKIKITIQVDPEGNFTYVNAVQHANPGDEVQWESPDGDFCVHFGDRTPFRGGIFECCCRRGGVSAPAIVDSGAVGTYKYTVAVRREQNGAVYIDGGCPELKVP